MNIATVVAIVIAILAIAVAAWAVLERQKTLRLRKRFGPEYDRLSQAEGSSRQAETILENREKRVAKYHIRSLNSSQAERFAREWRTVQEHFVDDPSKAVAEADQLIDQAMQARGYPVDDFERQAADLSVDYPEVVEHYRAAHAIDIRDDHGLANTEDLRSAMRHYHALFEQVIGVKTVHHQEVH